MKKFLSILIIAVAAVNIFVNSELQAAEPARTVFVNYHDNASARVGNPDESKFFQRLPSPKFDAAYDQIIKIPFDWSGREYFLNIENAVTGYAIYVNDKEVGSYDAPKSHVEFNITKFVVEGVNKLRLVPVSGDKFFNKELDKRALAEVYVTAEPKLRVRDYVVSAKLSENMSEGALDLEVILKSHFMNEKSMVVYCDLYNAEGKFITSYNREANFKNFSEDTIHFTALVDSVQMWSAENPALYTAVLRVFYDKRYTQYIPIKFGFREVALDKSLTINRQEIALRGVTLPYKAEYADVQGTLRKELTELRAIGFNAIMTQDHPFPESFYRLADSIGFYVIPVAAIAVTADNKVLELPQYTKNVVSRVVSMYENAKNHPSVIAFVMGGESGNGFNMQEAYLELKTRNDQRPMIYADASQTWNSDMILTAKTAPYTPEKPVMCYNLPTDNVEIFYGEKAIGGFISNLQRSMDLREVIIEPKNIKTGQFAITNRMDFSDLSDYILRYTVTEKGKIIKTADLALTAKRGTTEIVMLPLNEIKMRKGRQYTLLLEVLPKNNPLKQSFRNEFPLY